MKLTKYQHACLVVEKDGTTIVVDPGVYSHDFIMPSNVNAVVITHEHPDHFDEKLVNLILIAHPKAAIIAHESISGRFTEYTSIAAKVGEPFTVGSMTLQFFGGNHASISPTVQVPPNLGVLIDNYLYYPGDSFTVPEGVQVKALALPASAPWLKISESMEFLTRVRPDFTFPTHDAILSNEGKELADRMLGAVASGQNITYKRLDSSTIQLS